MKILTSGKQTMLSKPVRLSMTKLIQLRLQVRTMILIAAKRDSQQLHPFAGRSLKISAADLPFLNTCTTSFLPVFLPKQSIANQQRWTDQMRIARKRRGRLIGGKSVASWTGRQDLPPSLPSLLQETNEFICRGTEIARGASAISVRRCARSRRATRAALDAEGAMADGTLPKALRGAQ